MLIFHHKCTSFFSFNYSTFAVKCRYTKNNVSITLLIGVENYLKKIDKKDLTNKNESGLSIFFKAPKKLA